MDARAEAASPAAPAATHRPAALAATSCAAAPGASSEAAALWPPAAAPALWWPARAAALWPRMHAASPWLRHAGAALWPPVGAGAPWPPPGAAAPYPPAGAAAAVICCVRLLSADAAVSTQGAAPGGALLATPSMCAVLNCGPGQGALQACVMSAASNRRRARAKKWRSLFQRRTCARSTGTPAAPARRRLARWHAARSAL